MIVVRLLSPIVLITLCLMGCNPWYLVESEVRIATSENLPEITRTKLFDANVGTGVAVALSAPDRCANRSAAPTTGEALPAGELLNTTCGVEMAELERALVEAGYRVISWNAVRQMVLYEKGVTPLAAAKRLGAKVLFQVNSLELSVVERGSELQWERQFLESNSGGARGPAVPVREERAQALERGMEPFEAAARPRDLMSVTVNATAILVETGEAIWFYSWTHAEGSSGSVSTAQLFECHPRHLSRCFARQVQASTVREVRAGGRGSVSSPAESASPVDAAYYGLVREVVDDLVARFGSR